MHQIIEQHMNNRREVVDTAETFEAAKAKVEAMGVVMIEDDADHPGCADAYTNSGRCLAIQPEGFSL